MAASDPSGGDDGYEIAVELMRSGVAPETLSIADYESGYTPLHRALYFSNLRTAVLLMKMGATLDCVNTEELEALRASVSLKKQVGRRHIANIDNDGHSPLDLLSTSLQSNSACGRGVKLHFHFRLRKGRFPAGYRFAQPKNAHSSCQKCGNS